MSTPAQDAFNEHAAALRALGEALSRASSIRYLAAPGTGSSHHPGGIPNPTLDIVLEPRRAEVGAAITRATIALWPMTGTVLEHVAALDEATAAWSGDTHTGKKRSA